MVAAKVPEETLADWEQQGDAVSLVTIDLGMPETVINAVLDELGLSMEDHVAPIAYITDDE